MRAEAVEIQQRDDPKTGNASASSCRVQSRLKGRIYRCQIDSSNGLMKAAAFGSIRALMWETEGGCSEGRMASMDAADFFLPSTISDPIVRERAVLRVRLRERRPEHPPHAWHEPRRLGLSSTNLPPSLFGLIFQ